MKTICTLLLICVLNNISSAQVELSASMGINFINSPSLYDYMNQNYFSPGEIIEGFNGAVAFAGEAGYMLGESYQPSFEIGYLINSHTAQVLNGQYDLSYGILMVSMINYYVIKGTGYNFKFGGGGGVRFLSADETRPGTGTKQTFTSTGFGLLLRAEGNTLLSGNIYAKIGAQVGYELIGEPEFNGTPLVNPVMDENVNFNFLSIGLSLGVSYIF